MSERVIRGPDPRDGFDVYVAAFKAASNAVGITMGKLEVGFDAANEPFCAVTYRRGIKVCQIDFGRNRRSVP